MCCGFSRLLTLLLCKVTPVLIIQVTCRKLLKWNVLSFVLFNISCDYLRTPIYSHYHFTCDVTAVRCSLSPLPPSQISILPACLSAMTSPGFCWETKNLVRRLFSGEIKTWGGHIGRQATKKSTQKGVNRPWDCVEVRGKNERENV